MPFSGSELRIVVLAPLGRDAQLLRDALISAELNAQAVFRLTDALPQLREEGMGALLLTEEVLDPTSIALLASVFEHQPAWSDLPILILTAGGTATKLSRKREQDRLPLGSVTLLERPIRRATLISSIRSALRSRRRQLQVRDTLRERDRAEYARREGESRLATAIDTARLGSWELDVRSGELTASTIFRSIVDLDPGEPLTLEGFVSHIHTEDREAFQREFQAAIIAREAYASEHRIVWRDGTARWISFSGRPLTESRTDSARTEPVEEDDDFRFTGVALDITERVLSEMALRKADKLALVGRLSSSIAHEINNPLEAITNLLYLLSGERLEPEQMAYVVTAQEELARISEITAQTLTFNRQQNTYENAVMAEILDSVLTLYRGRLSMSNIQVERRYTYKQPLLCRPGELRQVFTNLIGNAFDATRNGGRIVVRARTASHPKTGKSGVRITIGDTGTGMTSEVKRHLFEAFHSTKGNNGTGLGLWISNGIIKKHGGSMWVSSSTATAHSGTVFSIFLPLPEI